MQKYPPHRRRRCRQRSYAGQYNRIELFILYTLHTVVSIVRSNYTQPAMYTIGKVCTAYDTVLSDAVFCPTTLSTLYRQVAFLLLARCPFLNLLCF